jgi:purine nucleosidase
MTVIDWWQVSDRAPNAHVMRDVNDDEFFDLLASRLASLP